MPLEGPEAKKCKICKLLIIIKIVTGPLQGYKVHMCWFLNAVNMVPGTASSSENCHCFGYELIQFFKTVTLHAYNNNSV